MHFITPPTWLPFGVWPCVGHAKDARPGVLQFPGNFIFELFTVHGLATPASARGVAALKGGQCSNTAASLWVGPMGRGGAEAG